MPGVFQYIYTEIRSLLPAAGLRYTLVTRVSRLWVDSESTRFDPGVDSESDSTVSVRRLFVSTLWGQRTSVDS
jgi:hypothetical protein